MGSLSSLQELCQLKFQLYRKHQITCKYDLIKQNLPEQVMGSLPLLIELNISIKISYSANTK